MDYSSYDIDFTVEGRRRVHLFSYVLGYSRRQYLRFVESQDLPTTLPDGIAIARNGKTAASKMSWLRAKGASCETLFDHTRTAGGQVR